MLPSVNVIVLTALHCSVGRFCGDRSDSCLAQWFYAMHLQSQLKDKIQRLLLTFFLRSESETWSISDARPVRNHEAVVTGVQ